MSAPLITVLGSLNMDLVALVDRAPLQGETVMGREFRTIPGGKGANQAIAAARAGASVAMIGAVGNDAFGDHLLATLQADGVDAARVRRTPTTTGTAHIVVDGAGHNAIVVVPGANGTVTALTEDDKSLIRKSRFLLMQLELPLSVVEEGAAVAAEAGVRVVLTPAPAQPLPEPLLRQVDWLVPNEHEAALLTGEPDLTRAGRMLSGLCRQVVITLGAEGCLLVTDAGRRSQRVDAVRVSPVDTTAAGDTFTGALAVALAEGMGTEDALLFATRAAAISVTRLGASPSMPRRKEIDSFQPGREGF